LIRPLPRVVLEAARCDDSEAMDESEFISRHEDAKLGGEENFAFVITLGSPNF